MHSAQKDPVYMLQNTHLQQGELGFWHNEVTILFLCANTATETQQQSKPSGGGLPHEKSLSCEYNDSNNEKLTPHCEPTFITGIFVLALSIPLFKPEPAKH